jgi:hypothetical protein
MLPDPVSKAYRQARHIPLAADLSANTAVINPGAEHRGHSGRYLGRRTVEPLLHDPVPQS